MNGRLSPRGVKFSGLIWSQLVIVPPRLSQTRMMISALTAGSEGTFGRMTAVPGIVQNPYNEVEVVARKGVEAAKTKGPLLPAGRAQRLAVYPVPVNGAPP